MYYLACVFLISLAVTISSGASLPEPVEKKLSGSERNAIVFDIPFSGGESSGKWKGDGNKFLVEGKTFNSLDEMIGILQEDKKKNEVPEKTAEPTSIVVPIARKFSSLKELFEILAEDDLKRPSKIGEETKQSYVKGSEVESSDYTIFFTS